MAASMGFRDVAIPNDDALDFKKCFYSAIGVAKQIGDG
jgi:hypothetical protein